MGSWIKCLCGGLIHTNLFTGTSVYRLIKDSDYDSLEEPIDVGKLSHLFFSLGIPVFRCHKCGRLAVEWDPANDPVFYLPEGKGETPTMGDESYKGHRETEPEDIAEAEETSTTRDDQDDDLSLKALEAIAEAEYAEMYDSRNHIGCYARAKEAFLDAITLACKMGREADAERLRRRLEHVKNVYRHQFT